VPFRGLAFDSGRDEAPDRKGLDGQRVRSEVSERPACRPASNEQGAVSGEEEAGVVRSLARASSNGVLGPFTSVDEGRGTQVSPVLRDGENRQGPHVRAGKRISCF